ncbi:enoyl-CoA hydratase/carnithine racemase [Amycolatopsis echigonensis]|uniref:Enoyl-CoA hydratase/carnithine racemase n=1 Tax=Amycolatopsis echigonensis TaxID=2576905 RepID=A0A2N3X051_9PSEU|nr:enoyl-CoA hydratase/isomerase family protein [Amycolatopsis niigatensis]PKV99502.1 enoyl-CoA hydratase/carnithine racemase [Amycolatopsis niigatensis]
MTADLANGVESTVDSGIAVLVIGSGQRRNALPGRGWTAIEEAVTALGADPDTRVIVVHGRGGTFCSGSDLTEWAGATAEFVEDSFARMESAFRAVERCPVPVVAAITGAAAGAGCQLALACDLRLAADTARIGMPIARHGILASPAFAARLSTLAGPGLARELLYTGRLLDGRAAAAAGLVNRSCPDASLDAEVDRLASAIAGQPRPAVLAAKRAVSATLAPVRAATGHSPGPAVSMPEFHAAMAAFGARGRPDERFR